ncbi:M50 family metallopeptidase [Paenibacillus sp. SYP-B4298]|uniref:M50 family metallopeptidase n=1 Tax=Paenibacillus sp. SYP-B4298 TaxID=2996034 RepID=UPI0022DD92C6|nr:M50 family metallopeptidase [Paenibacillus sp. SYP-B4298]
MNSWWRIILFLIGSAVLTRFIPFSSFFRNLNTLIHEFGHALVTLLLSGRVLRIDLNPDHSGVTYSMLPSSSYWGIMSVSLAGYILAALMSVLLFYLYYKKLAKAGLWLLTVIAVINVVFFVHEGFGFQWLLGLIVLNAAVLFIGSRRGRGSFGELMLRGYYLLIAFLILEESALSPLVLVFYSLTEPSAAGDAANLAELTSIPALVWSLLFTLVSVYCAKLSLGWLARSWRTRRSAGSAGPAEGYPSELPRSRRM